MNNRVAKADLHVHSKFSKRPSEWILQKLGCSESYTEPDYLYNLAKKRGMEFVTITDHNTLAGSLEIAHLENTFVSEEITTYFPEDRCKIHVLAYDVTEKQHEDISKFRENIFDLVKYLNEANIVHAVAHPMFSINGRLTFEYFENLLVLFKNFELNGSRDDFQNQVLADILKNLNRRRIESLANKYDLQPMGTEPWLKNVIGGSDDHSSLTIASIYTEIEDATTVAEFLQGIMGNRARVGGRASVPKTWARNLYSIAYQFYKHKFSLGRHTNDISLLRFAERILIPSEGREEGIIDRLRGYIGYRRPEYLYKKNTKSLESLLLTQARSIIAGDPEMSEIIKKNNGESPEIMEETWFRFVNGISEQVSKKVADSVLENLSGVDLFSIFNTIGSTGFLYTMILPYVIAYGLFSKDRKFCRDYSCQFFNSKHKKPEDPPKVAHFTDTFYEMNGVARTLQQQLEIARKNGKHLRIITCGLKDNNPGVVSFNPIGEFELPDYPELKLYYPPLLSILDYCYNQNFTHIHSATPGPMGLVALAVSRILNLPLYSTYHTALPQYTGQITDDTLMGDLMWKYMAWYYNQADIVFVPSRATGEELAENGILKKKIRFYSRGIDVKKFHPSKRNGFLRERFNLNDDAFKLLYVGRISKEKNLALLVDIYKRVFEKRKDIHLVLVGDGPYINDLKSALKNHPVTFTGYLSGEDLCQAYASSDIFIFPSETDTFGNVVLEAQASGLPVIVTDQGGPKENMIPGKTGYVISSGEPDDFAEVILKMRDDGKLLRRMGLNARNYMENRTFESAYLENWNNYKIQ